MLIQKDLKERTILDRIEQRRFRLCKWAGLIPDSVHLHCCVDSHCLLILSLSFVFFSTLAESFAVLESIVLRPDVDWENGNRLILSARVNLKIGMPWGVRNLVRSGGIDVNVFVENAILRGYSTRNSRPKDDVVDQVIDSIQPGQQFGIELKIASFLFKGPGPQRAYLPFDFRSVYDSI